MSRDVRHPCRLPTRDADIVEACQEYGISMVHTHIRAFHH